MCDFHSHIIIQVLAAQPHLRKNIQEMSSWWVHSYLPAGVSTRFNHSRGSLAVIFPILSSYSSVQLLLLLFWDGYTASGFSPLNWTS